jgi:hypothetical protein
LGIDLSEERRRYGSNTRALMVAARNLINNATPRTSEQLLVVDAPPAGAFDGVNTVFTLSGPVAGQNLGVTHHRTASNTALTLTKTQDNPPGADSFLFDVNDPTHFTVGTPPQSGDMLVATFKTR